MKRPRKIMQLGWKKDEVEWIQSDWYCPECGVKGMWQDIEAAKSGGDYYYGNSAICAECNYELVDAGFVEDPPEEKKHWWDATINSDPNDDDP